jgi:hypothetical protein
MDYSSLRKLAAYLGNTFWKNIEIHHPGIDSLHLPADVAQAWKKRLRTMPKTIDTASEKNTITVERISYRQCLTPVRAFYLDLAQWAIEEPERWARCGLRLARSHSGCTQRQTRLAHTNVTGRPPAGRSHTHVGRRSCRRACAPDVSGHHARGTRSAAHRAVCSGNMAFTGCA